MPRRSTEITAAASAAFARPPSPFSGGIAELRVKPVLRNSQHQEASMRPVIKPRWRLPSPWRDYLS